MKNGIIVIALVAIIALIGAGIGYQFNQPKKQAKERVELGGVSIGSDYHATTTKDSIIPVIVTGNGTLGSVIITITGTAILDLYNATTTNANLRAITATSSLPLLAHFGPSPTVGTYIFDQVFSNGLMAVWGSGTVSTTTITYRQY